MTFFERRSTVKIVRNSARRNQRKAKTRFGSSPGQPQGIDRLRLDIFLTSYRRKFRVPQIQRTSATLEQFLRSVFELSLRPRERQEHPSSDGCGRFSGSWRQAGSAHHRRAWNTTLDIVVMPQSRIAQSRADLADLTAKFGTATSDSAGGTDARLVPGFVRPSSGRFPRVTSPSNSGCMFPFQRWLPRRAPGRGAAVPPGVREDRRPVEVRPHRGGGRRRDLEQASLAIRIGARNCELRAAMRWPQSRVARRSAQFASRRCARASGAPRRLLWRRLSHPP